MTKMKIIKLIKSGELKVGHCIMCNNVYGIYLNSLSFKMKKNEFINFIGQDLTTAIAGCSRKCYKESLIYIFGKGTKNIEDVPDKYKSRITEYIKKWQGPHWQNKEINSK